MYKYRYIYMACISHTILIHSPVDGPLSCSHHMDSSVNTQFSISDYGIKKCYGFNFVPIY